MLPNCSHRTASKPITNRLGRFAGAQGLRRFRTGAADITATLVRYTGPAISRQDEKAWQAAVPTEDEKGRRAHREEPRRGRMAGGDG